MKILWFILVLLLYFLDGLIYKLTGHSTTRFAELKSRIKAITLETSASFDGIASVLLIQSKKINIFVIVFPCNYGIHPFVVDESEIVQSNENRLML